MMILRKMYPEAGDELGKSIENAIKYCTNENCSIILNFNGFEREINKGSYLEGLSKNWYNLSYNEIEDSREKKLNIILNK